MSFPPKIQTWLKADYFPQRCLLSGTENGLGQAIEIAAQLLDKKADTIQAGLESDVLLLKDEGQSFKIGDDQNPDQDSARGLIKWVSQKPIAAYRVVILENFERASREAPQTLLKILEEPPAQALFLFTTKNHHQILPTILSRMTVVQVPSATPSDLGETVTNFFEPGNLHLKLKKIETLEALIKKEGSKQPLHDFIEDLLKHGRSSAKDQKHLEKVFQAQEKINRNINHRLVLEQLALEVSL